MTDPQRGDPHTQARVLLEEGVRAIQLRCKGWSTEARVALARTVADDAAALGRDDDVLLIVNDDVHAVSTLRECRPAVRWAAHLGQDDGPDPGLPFGRSTHTLAHVAAAGPAHYLGFGPVYGTRSKDTPYAPRGTELLAVAVTRAAVPVVAIGGIHVGNIDAVRATGVAAWAVIAGVWDDADPRAAIRALR
jgi:thiamine-phosphate diphosphorylase